MFVSIDYLYFIYFKTKLDILFIHKRVQRVLYIDRGSSDLSNDFLHNIIHNIECYVLKHNF